MKILVYLLTTSILFSCGEMWEPLEIDLPLEKQKLVVNCYFAADSSWYIRVWNSTRPFGEDTAYIVRDARVILTEEGLGFQLWFDDYYSAYRMPRKAVAGRQYSLEVSAQGYETIFSSAIVPHAVPIREVKSFAAPNAISQAGIKRNFDVTFSDPPGEENFYAISIEYLDRLEFPDRPAVAVWSSLYPESADPAFEGDRFIEYFHYYNNERTEVNLLFDDTPFEGQDHTFRVKVAEWWAGNEQGSSPRRYRILLKSLSKAYYQYRITYNLQVVATEDPFANPAQVFNNIENGYGIFAAYNQSAIEYLVE
jgi:hypothetical protein